MGSARFKIGNMFEYGTLIFGRSLAETIAWCADQPITGCPEESPDFRHRRALVEEANRLSRAVFDRFNRNFDQWDQITATPQWHQSRALLEEADPLNLSSLDGQLRSAALKPSLPLDHFENELWAEAVAAVVAKRSEALRSAPIVADPSVLTGGKLLEFIPVETLMDGAAKYSSNGFYDVNNVPPWDTWVCFSEGTLVSWVPPLLLEIAGNGLHANPEGCIRWAK